MTPKHTDNIDTKQTTHFGYQQVPAQEKASMVADVFNSVAARYDLMNDLMSGGIHRLWKRYTIEVSAVRKGNAVLDIAGGTGDLTHSFSQRVEGQGQVILADINNAMLNTGRDKLIDRGNYSNIDYVQCDAQQLPFAENQFDCISIAFGLRNITDKPLALESMYKCLKPGGRLLVLEFSKPKNEIFSKLYDQYSFKILPKIGKLVTNDADSYRYLAESIRMHPDQEKLKNMIESSGFEQCTYYNLTGGIVALHKATKY